MLKVVSLFTGVGGLDFGFEAAGFETAVAVELDPICCRSLRQNRAWPVLEGDIRSFQTKDLLRVAKLRRGQADALIGGPSCQPFSKSGYWANGDARRLNDPRSDTLGAYLRVLEETLPRSFLLENVYGLAYEGKDEGLTRILRGVERINRQHGTKYRPYWRVLNAADYGVPQLRERVFIIGSRDGDAFRFPAPTHGEPELEKQSTPLGNLAPYRTAWDALGDLPAWLNDPSLRMTGKWADLLPTIPEGQNYLWHTARGGGEPLFGWRTRYWSFLLKLAKNRPSWTVQAQPGSATGPFHWTNRKLSPRELCRLQTLPDDIVLSCSRGDAQRMLGNAVPSLLAEVLAWEMRRQLIDGVRRRRPYKLLPARRLPAPPPEPIARLPAQFKALIGEHPEHPGEGLGNRARQRDESITPEARAA